MLDLDAPDHTRLRSLVHKAFTPRLVENLAQRVQSLADELIDSALPKGRMDLINDFALPLPATVIAEMLGVPAADQVRFHRWSNAMLAANWSIWSRLKVIPSGLAFLRYIQKLVKHRKREPRDDLVSALVKAEELGDHLHEEELVAMIVLLLIAGHETTVNLIGNGMLALFEHPQQLARLRSDPALMDAAIEELLRFYSPVEMATERYAREDLSIEGVRIPKGGVVFAVLASANRDERQFDRPDELDLARSPNKHLAFGRGIHYCLGAPLARLEGRIAIETLLRRAPETRLDIEVEKLRWKKGLILRGLREMPVDLGKSS